MATSSLSTRRIWSRSSQAKATRQQWFCSTFSFGEWDDPEMTLHPGEGAVIHNPSANPIRLQFVGEVNVAFHTRVPLKYSIRGSALPLAGGLTSGLGCLPFGPGCQIYRMTSSGSYTAYTFDGDTWSPAEPRVEVGEAFWCRNPINAFVWEHVLRQEQLRHLRNSGSLGHIQRFYVEYFGAGQSLCGTHAL